MKRRILSFSKGFLAAVLATYLSTACSGCALTKPGTELVARLGMYGVDEHQESQQLHYDNRPYLCQWWPSIDGCQQPTLK